MDLILFLKVIVKVILRASFQVLVEISIVRMHVLGLLLCVESDVKGYFYIHSDNFIKLGSKKIHKILNQNRVRLGSIYKDQFKSKNINFQKYSDKNKNVC